MDIWSRDAAKDMYIIKHCQYNATQTNSNTNELPQAILCLQEDPDERNALRLGFEQRGSGRREGEVLRTKNRSFPSAGRLTVGRTRTTTWTTRVRRSSQRRETILSEPTNFTLTTVASLSGAEACSSSAVTFDGATEGALLGTGFNLGDAPGAKEFLVGDISGEAAATASNGRRKAGRCRRTAAR
ncbi:hypothetical protein ABZP36_017054 [Zizania latifolia]